MFNARNIKEKNRPFDGRNALRFRGTPARKVNDGTPPAERATDARGHSRQQASLKGSPNTASQPFFQRFTREPNSKEQKATKNGRIKKNTSDYFPFAKRTIARSILWIYSMYVLRNRDTEISARNTEQRWITHPLTITDSLSIIYRRSGNDWNYALRVGNAWNRIIDARMRAFQSRVPEILFENKSCSMSTSVFLQLRNEREDVRVYIIVENGGYLRGKQD